MTVKAVKTPIYLVDVDDYVGNYKEICGFEYPSEQLPRKGDFLSILNDETQTYQVKKVLGVVSSMIRFPKGSYKTPTYGVDIINVITKNVSQNDMWRELN